MAVLLVGMAVPSLAQPNRNPVPEEIPLWESRAPGALGETDADRPTLTIHRAGRNSSGTGIVVAPGGGYGTLAVDHEGRQIAAEAMAIAAAVCIYSNDVITIEAL